MADRRDRFVLLWQGMTTSDAAEVQVSEYIKLDKLSMTVVGTSVNEERAFSAMSFAQSPL